MLVLDKIEFPVIFWGSLKAGIIPVPLNTLLASDVYDVILRDSRGRGALFVSRELFPVIEPILAGNPYLQVVFVVGEETGPAGDPKNSVFSRMFDGAKKTETQTNRLFSFDGQLVQSEASAPIIASPDENAFWLYSSGSTGEPKGVRHVHSSLKATADTYGQNVLGVVQSDIIYSAAKLFFAYGLGNGMTFPMSVGATTVLLPGAPDT